ncbi:MAG: ABC transporter permease, partial [Candidatus Rokuibacteriota bacterium]
MKASVAVALPRRFAWSGLRARLRGAPALPVAILTVVIGAALFADALAPYNPELGNLRHRHRPPAWVAGGDATYLLGTDHLGR